MKIVFSKTITGDDENIISLEQIERDVLFKISFEHFITNKYEEQSFLMSKKQLHDFIGSLLHLQSKLKGGSNE